jgi:hypothetical protein
VAKVHGRRDVLGLSSQDAKSRFAVPLTLVRTAFKEHSSDFDIRCEFIKVSEEFYDAQYVENIIVDSIKEDFAENPSAWLFVARRVNEIETRDSLSFVLLEKGISLNPNNSQMWEVYSSFLSDCQLRADSADKVSEYVSMNDEICSRAHQQGVMTEAMYLKWSRLTVKGCGPSRECDILRKGIKAHATSELWVAFLHASKWCSDYEGLVTLLEEALGSLPTPVEQGVLSKLYQPVLEKIMTDSSVIGFETGTEIFVVALRKSATPPLVVCSQYLSWMFSVAGIEGARSAYKRMRHLYQGESAQLGNVSLDFIGLLRSCSSFDVKEVREIFESCSSFSGASSVIYEAYISFEQSLGNIDRASAIKWRLNSSSSA